MSTKSTSPLIPVSEQQLKRLARTIREKSGLLSQKRVTIGFDGFIDNIVRLIETQEPGEAPQYFPTIESFGQYILQKKSGSFGVETETRMVKIGGNMPILANAMGQQGLAVNCIGALGYPQIHERFTQLPPSCKLYSFAQPGFAIAYEFNDGKILTADMADLHKTDWNKIKTRIPLDEIRDLFAASDMIALLNWSEIDASTDIWQGILKEVLPAYDAYSQFAFFDLSDCSKRTAASIQQALGLINDFTKYTRVILSLNRNEAGIIASTLTGDEKLLSVSQLAETIYRHLNIDVLLVHTSKEVMGITKQEQLLQSTLFTGEPVLSTGAGDNFNAGFCTAWLLEPDLGTALSYANATSGYYVRNGQSGGLNQILEFLENYTIN